MNLGENPELTDSVEPEGELRSWMVDYVGRKTQPEDNNVTMEMIIDVLSSEFPEFLMAIAEENWIRGYHQALEDVSEGERLAKEEQEKQQLTDEEWVEGYKKCKTGKCGKCG